MMDFMILVSATTTTTTAATTTATTTTTITTNTTTQLFYDGFYDTALLGIHCVILPGSNLFMMVFMILVFFYTCSAILVALS